MMHRMKVDPILERYGPPPTIPLAPWLVEARGAVAGAVGELLKIDDDQLDHRWWWRDDPEGDTEVRYAFYRAVEALERAAGLARDVVAAAGTPPDAARPFALATAARWDLHGLLAPLVDADLDADAGGREWTIRQTLAHVVYVQRAYPSYGAWWLSREQGGDLPPRAPDEIGEGFPEEADEGLGSLADIRGRLDAVMDVASERMAALDESQMATPARWAGYAVDVGFRLGRMSSHLQEHTVQVEKTLVMLGRTPREADRLARLVLRAYGRLEAALYALPAALAEAGREPLEAAVGEIAEVVGHVRRPGSVTSFDAD
jgi:uncharacterized damage-inducible protein DinB